MRMRNPFSRASLIFCAVMTFTSLVTGAHIGAQSILFSLVSEQI